MPRSCTRAAATLPSEARPRTCSQLYLQPRLGARIAARVLHRLLRRMILRERRLPGLGRRARAHPVFVRGPEARGRLLRSRATVHWGCRIVLCFSRARGARGQAWVT